ncbi:MAG: N-formylglutamate amidohydrolase [Hyphomicrobiales bacterium]|nr:N-formylglutamate amidohydrolase [Hyphomicrobiales bacterium]
MSEVEIHAVETELDPPFLVSGAQTQTAPYVFNSPHSGMVYPRSFIEASRLTHRALRKSEDAYVNELFGDVTALGAVLMQAHFPRAYLDVNREPYELDPVLIQGKMPDYANTHSVRVIGGLGTIARMVNDQEEIYREPMQLEAALTRIRLLYDPYHAALSEALQQTQRQFGFSCLIDCHSMPSQPHGSGYQPKVDFVLGDRHGTSCAQTMVRFVEATLKAWGFTVALNKPYAGGYITERYGRPKLGAHALQIEINRALYMDENSLVKRGSFEVIRAKLTLLAQRLIQNADEILLQVRRAAE